MPYSPTANGFGCHVFLQCHLQYSTASGFSVSYIRNFLSGNFAGSVAVGEVTKYSEYGSRVSLALPCCKDWHRKLNRRYANGKKSSKKVPIVICWYQLPVPLRLSRATGGVVLLDYYTVSHVVIKPNQEPQTRETNGEQSGGGRRDAGRRNKSA